ncbi:hypothetical protein [Streptomyces sp. NPDC020377]|uniref:hypothetical protein n=1 Tax=Streptomyces sp. NPDC020377 TaxID=3365070 RepID=UPI003799347C
MERSELSERMAEVAERLQGLRALQDQLVEAVREVQGVITFGTHPELVALDDELDILYRGQM